jgi:hypothetical protein
MSPHNLRTHSVVSLASVPLSKSFSSWAHHISGFVTGRSARHSTRNPKVLRLTVRYPKAIPVTWSGPIVPDATLPNVLVVPSQLIVTNSQYFSRPSVQSQPSSTSIPLKHIAAHLNSSIISLSNLPSFSQACSLASVATILAFNVAGCPTKSSISSTKTFLCSS